jgi:hypothetical protein
LTTNEIKILEGIIYQTKLIEGISVEGIKDIRQFRRTRALSLPLWLRYKLLARVVISFFIAKKGAVVKK